MTSAQKVIKYFAISLAVLIIFSIASAAMGSLGVVANLLSSEKIELTQSGAFLEGKIPSEVSVLDINVYSLNVWIKQGDAYRFETNNESVQCKVLNEKLVVSQKEPSFLDTGENSSLIIYIPADITPKKLKLDSAAGNVIVQDIKVQNLSFSVAAGELQLKKVTAAKKTDIDGGIGKIDIKNCKLTNLDADLGMGKFVLTCALYGKCNIDCGIGNAVITLKGNENDYRIKAEKGIGLLTVCGNSIAGETALGDGDNSVDIDAGIGAVTVDFYKK